MKLHLGCGLTTPTGWINVDGSWNARLARWPRTRRALGATGLLPRSLVEVPWDPSIRFHDLRRPLPFRDGTMTAIYSSHTYEHLYASEAERMLRECHRVLTKGGVLRLVVPDLRSIVDAYLAKAGSPDPATRAEAADLMVGNLRMRERAPPPRNVLLQIYRARADFNSHKWMYDAPALAAKMEAAGFAAVDEMPYLKSRIGDISDIEQADRVLDGAGVCVEGAKP